MVCVAFEDKFGISGGLGIFLQGVGFVLELNKMAWLLRTSSFGSGSV